MIKFFKENIAMIWKVILTQIAMMIFGLIVVLATAMINEVLCQVAGALSILLYLFVLYSHFIEKGNEDKIKIDGGRMEKKNFYGLFVFDYVYQNDEIDHYGAKMKRKLCLIDDKTAVRRLFHGK